jgi:hypothetical protein
MVMGVAFRGGALGGVVDEGGVVDLSGQVPLVGGVDQVQVVDARGRRRRGGGFWAGLGVGVAADPVRDR